MENCFLLLQSFFPFRREHEVRDISQDPDISCLLFPSCSSDWCQRPCVARFPVTSSNHVLGKLVGYDKPWGPSTSVHRDVPGGPGRRQPVVPEGGAGSLCGGGTWVWGSPGGPKPADAGVCREKGLSWGLGWEPSACVLAVSSPRQKDPSLRTGWARAELS